MSTTKPNMELLELFGAARDGQITTDQAARLESLVGSDDKALDDYVRLMTMHAIMKRSRQPRAAQPVEVAGVIRPGRRWAWAGGIAAVLAVAVGATVAIVMSLTSAPAYATTEASWIFAKLTNGAANLSRTVDLVSPTLAKRPRGRTPLRADAAVSIESGRAYLDLFRGPELMLEGPVEFTLAFGGGFLHRGHLAVRSMDAANVFTLQTPTTSITGSLAEVSVNVHADGSTDIAVLWGTIDARLRPESGDPRNPRKVRINAGEARRFDGRDIGPVTPISESQLDATHWTVPHGKPVTHPIAAPLPIVFDASALLPYDDQDGLFKQPTIATVLDGGRTLKLEGNCWKRVDLDYPATAQTVIEFDYRSTSQGELHGIGFDTDNSHRSGRTIFQLYGRDALIDGIYSFRGYHGDGQWQHYRIPVGRFYTGQMKNLLFFADDDARGQAQSEFRDVKVYDEHATPTIQ